MRRNLRNAPGRRPNPLRELVAEQRRSAEIAVSRQRAEQLKKDLPALIEDQVGEHIQKLEVRLLKDFQTLGQRAIEESTAVLNEQLNEPIDTLEQISSIQSRTPYAAQMLQPSVELVKAEPQGLEEMKGRVGFCPNCTSTKVRRAYRHGLFEEFLRLFFIAPFRCRACRHKSYRF